MKFGYELQEELKVHARQTTKLALYVIVAAMLTILYWIVMKYVTPVSYDEGSRFEARLFAGLQYIGYASDVIFVVLFVLFLKSHSRYHVTKRALAALEKRNPTFPVEKCTGKQTRRTKVLKRDKQENT